MTPAQQTRRLIEEVARERGVDPAQITSRCRTVKVFRARMEAAIRLRARGDSSLQIGRILKHDHTTILYYLGSLKKKPGKQKWRVPVVRHVRWLRPKKSPGPPKMFLVPYAGDMSEYEWKERRT